MSPRRSAPRGNGCLTAELAMRRGPRVAGYFETPAT